MNWRNLKSAYDRLKDRILEELGKDRENINKIKKFYAFLSSHVILVRVKTETRMDALKIFATINNRGVNLEPIDLVKNLMFMEANKQEFNRLKKSWKKMVDTLYKHKEKPMRFLRYFVLSQYENTDSLKGNIYGWLLKSQNKKYYAKEPLSFVKNLIEACNHYTSFTKGKDTKGKENPHIENIRIISNSARLPFMVLLAGTHLSDNLFSQLCKELENIFFVYLLIRERTSSFERKFTDWCATLRQVQSQEDFEEFISSKIIPEKVELSSQFENAFLHLTEKSITQSQLRYILAKLTQYINDKAYGIDPEISSLKPYISNKKNKLEIEHILSQKITPEILVDFDKPNRIEDYIHRLGNLTLLEQPINTSIKNKPFSFKKEYYPSSKYLLTQTISRTINVGQNTSINKAVSNLKSFETWTSSSIEERQKILTELAKKVWEMP